MTGALNIGVQSYLEDVIHEMCFVYNSGVCAFEDTQECPLLYHLVHLDLTVLAIWANPHYLKRLLTQRETIRMVHPLSTYIASNEAMGPFSVPRDSLRLFQVTSLIVGELCLFAFWLDEFWSLVATWQSCGQHIIILEMAVCGVVPQHLFLVISHVCNKTYCSKREMLHRSIDMMYIEFWAILQKRCGPLTN